MLEIFINEDFEDEWREEDEWRDICECGREADEECDQCGKPLCFMCAEMGANFCSEHPDGDYEPYEPDDS